MKSELCGGGRLLWGGHSDGTYNGKLLVAELLLWRRGNLLFAILIESRQ